MKFTCVFFFAIVAILSVLAGQSRAEPGPEPILAEMTGVMHGIFKEMLGGGIKMLDAAKQSADKIIENVKDRAGLGEDEEAAEEEPEEADDAEEPESE